MITNPQIGMRVICSTPSFDMAEFRGRVGIIQSVLTYSRYAVRVLFDSDPLNGPVPMSAQEMDYLSPEAETQQQDKLRRAQHADKYL